MEDKDKLSVYIQGKIIEQIKVDAKDPPKELEIKNKKYSLSGVQYGVAWYEPATP